MTGADILEVIELYAEHGAANMVEAQEAMSDAALEIRRLREENKALKSQDWDALTETRRTARERPQTAED